MVQKKLFLGILGICITAFFFYYNSDAKYSGKQQRPAAVKFTNGLPVKPADGPPYINLTSLRFLDSIGKFEMERGRKYVGAEFAMAILEDLPEGKSIEDYAADLFKAWDIGRQTGGKGILYVLVRSKGLLKIETSYELEPLFPDTFIHSYQDTIKEFYKNEMLGDVVSHLVVEMIHRIQDPTYEMALYEGPAGKEAKGDFLSGGGGVSEKGYVSNRIEKNLEQIKGQKFLLTKYENAISPTDAANKYLAAMQDGQISPNLELLTEGSRYMEMEYHRSLGYQRNKYKEYQKALPYEISQSGGYAMAVFSKDSVRPIYLRQNDKGLWLVDQTRMWSSVDGFVGKDSDHYSPVTFFNSSPWSFVFAKSKKRALYAGADRPNPVPLSYNLKDIIQKLEQNLKQHPDSAEAHFFLADILFFENYWIKDALTLVEKGLKLEPYNERYLRRAIYMGVKLPDFSKTAEHYETLLKIHPGDKYLLYYYQCFKKNNVTCF